MLQEIKKENEHIDFELYRFVFETAVEIFEEIFETSKRFPREKIFLIDQLRRHSKLVCINLAEAWRAKKDKDIFLDKISEAAQEASRVQNCLKFAVKCKFLGNDVYRKLDSKYEDIFEMLCDGVRT
ncbi:MAG: four helix bundle protein [Nitrospirae bacterium]|jgi:four helix bundle protein|nr:four helix bundle protein [Nitrospirota bacterium]